MTARRLKRNDFELNHNFALASCCMIFSENRYPLFRIMLSAEQSLAGVEEFLRVDGFAFDPNLIVQMRSGRPPSRAELADDAACAHGLADPDIDLREMTIAAAAPDLSPSWASALRIARALFS